MPVRLDNKSVGRSSYDDFDKHILCPSRAMEKPRDITLFDSFEFSNRIGFV
jgi:hypothetical protein